MKRSGFLGVLAALPLVGVIFKGDDSPGRLTMPYTNDWEGTEPQPLRVSDFRTTYDQLSAQLAESFQPYIDDQVFQGIEMAKRLGIDRVTIKR